MLKYFDNEYIKTLDPCADGWKNLIKHYPNWSGTPLDFLELEHVPVEDKQWLLLREDFLLERDLHLYACFCAESVLHIFEKEYPNDKRSRQAIEAKRKWLNGEMGNSELDAAWAAARAAAWAAGDAAGDAAGAAVWAARAAARAAWDAAWAAARAAGAAEKEKQLDELKRVFKGLDDREELLKALEADDKESRYENARVREIDDE
jgi:hypothetical protein